MSCPKIAQNCALLKRNLVENDVVISTKSGQNLSLTRRILAIFLNCAQIIRRFFKKSGVDVRITIFCDFWQFLAKKMAFFSKTNVMINFFCKN
jgi:hypothetical protein